jgi:hypothetical protein
LAFESYLQIISTYPNFPPEVASPRLSKAANAAQIAKAFSSKHPKPASKALIIEITMETT